MSAPRNPFKEIERFFERMSRQFDETSRMWMPNGPFGQWAHTVESMAIDLVEHDNEFVVTVDLPGFEREDVSIEITDHMLRIEAEHEEALNEEDETYLRRERRRESTQRSIRLPGEVDKEGVTARMKNGVLTVTLPRLEAEEAREIEIEDE